MENLTYLINVLEPVRRYLANIIKEKSIVSKNKQSKKKPPNQTCRLFQTVKELLRLMDTLIQLKILNLNRELIGGLK